MSANIYINARVQIIEEHVKMFDAFNTLLERGIEPPVGLIKDIEESFGSDFIQNALLEEKIRLSPEEFFVEVPVDDMYDGDDIIHKGGGLVISLERLSDGSIINLPENTYAIRLYMK